MVPEEAPHAKDKSWNAWESPTGTLVLRGEIFGSDDLNSKRNARIQSKKTGFGVKKKAIMIANEW